jgi:ribosomal protein S18 acetylase RimI-like enzyme
MRRDDWLSSVVTKECFVLDESEIQSVQEHELSADSFYTCRLTNQAARLQNTLLNLGFRRVVSEVELHGSVVTETRVTSSCVVRRALPTDQKTIENIATNSFRHDRFHADALLDRSRADLIKKHWVAAAFERGSARNLWVAERENTVTGFCLTQRLQKAVRIDLIAVALTSQGLGIGRALVASLPACYGVPIIDLQVGTQKQNEESIRLYMKSGMSVSQERMVFHRGRF